MKRFLRIKIRTWIALGVILILLPLVVFRAIYSAIGAPPVSSATWRMDEGSGTSVGDGSNNSNTGTVTNAAWKGKELCFSENCLFFDGNGDLVSRADDADFDFTNGNSFTFSLWFKHGVMTAGTQVLVAKHNATAGGYKITMDSNGNITCGFDDDSSYGPEDFVTSTAANYDDNKWHHMACVKSAGTNLTLYLDGTSVGTPDSSFTATGTLENADTFYLGMDGDGTSNDYAGFLDEFRMYRQALTASEIKVEYNKASAVRFEPQESDFLNEGLAGYWKLDETSGNAADASGNLTTLTNVSTTAYSAAKFGNGMEPDGTADYLGAADNTSLSITGSLTLAAWIEPDDVSGTENIIAKWDGANESYRLTKEGANVRMYIDSDSNYQASTGSPLAANTKAHVAGVYEATTATVKIFVNGAEVASSTTGTIPTSIGDDGGSFHLGSEDSSTAAANFYDGHIDEARVYSRALPGGEIKSLYNWQPGPVSYWRFDDSTGTTVADGSGNNNSATITDSSTPGSWSTGKYGGAYFLDGANDTDMIVPASDLALSTRNTISFWVNFDELNAGLATDCVIGGSNNGTSEGYMSYFDETNVYSRQNLVGGVSVAHGGITLDTWYHFAIVRDGASITFYKNGAQIGTTQTYASNNSFTFGSLANFDTGSTAFALEGLLDEYRIYNYPRTAQQVVEDMNAGHPAGGSPIGTATSYWKFDEGYGTTAFDDNDPNSNDLTLSSASWTVSGKFDHAWNGTGAVWVSRADDADFDVAAADNYAISLWFKSDAAANPGATEYLFNKASATVAGYAVYATTSGTVCFGIDDDTTWGPDVSSCSPHDIYDNTWHHIVAVRNVATDQLELYVDGKLIDSDSDTTSASLENTQVLYIGDRDGSNNGDEFNGDVDEVKVFRGAITGDQAKILMTANSATNFGAGAATSEYAQITGTSTAAPFDFWNFNETTGQTVNDIGSNSLTGCTLGMTSASTTDDPSWTNGKVGGALLFDGSSDVVDCDDQSTLDFADGTSITLMAWINRSSVTNDGIIIGKKTSSGSNTAGFSLYQWSSSNGGNTCLYVSDGTDQLERCTNDNATITTGQWIHIAAVFDDTSSLNTTMYLNGIDARHAAYDVGTIANVGSLSNTAFFHIGAQPQGLGSTPNNFFAGTIDQVQIFNYALTPNQIMYQMHNSAGALVHYKMDDCTGTTVNDLSLNADNGTAVDGTWSGAGGSNTSAGTCSTSGAWFNGANGKFNSSLDFDGTDDVVTVTNTNAIDFDMGLRYGFSFATWIYAGSDGENDVGEIFDKGASTYCRTDTQGTTDLDLECSLDLTGSGGDADATLNIANALTTNTWHHVVVGYTDDADDEITVYVDGRSVGSSTNGSGSPDLTGDGDTTNDDANNLLIGGSSAANFDGQIDEFMVFPYELSSTEIRKLLNESSGARFGPTTGTP